MSQFQTHFMIYIGNLSMYYVTSVLLSIILVIVTWYMHFKNIAVKHEDKEQVEKAVETIKAPVKLEEKSVLVGKIEEKIIPEEKIEGTNSMEEQIEEFVDMVPTLRNITKEAIQKISASLTPEQLEAEKEAEHRQLSAILELLQKQQDKFQVGSMEELEGQLKLYR